MSWHIHKGEFMFQLSVIDHIRLSFGSAIAAYEGHAEAAGRLALWSWYAKLATLVLAAGTAVLSGLAVQRGGVYQPVAAVVAVIALIGVAAYVAFDPQPRIYGHRASAARLWLVCEKFRALLAEAHDELLDLSAIKEKRNALLQEVAGILEQGPPADRETYRITRNVLAGTHQEGYSDADVDRYLPQSLRSVSSASA
jgi:hypothetical protein